MRVCIRKRTGRRPGRPTSPHRRERLLAACCVIGFATTVAAVHLWFASMPILDMRL
jgi:hypothetical protein